MNSRKFLCSSYLAIAVSLTVLVALSIAGQVVAVSHPYKATLTGKNEVPPGLMDTINKTQVAKQQAKNIGGNDTKILDRLNDLRSLKLNERGNILEQLIDSAGVPANGFYAFIKKWGTDSSGDGQFVYPHGIAIDSSGNVYVSDSGNSRIQKFTNTGTFITHWGTKGSGDGQFDWPIDVAVESSGNVYVSDISNSRIQKFTSDGTFITKWGTEGSADGQFRYQFGIAVHSSGRVYVADDHNYRMQVFLWKPIFHNPIEPPVLDLSKEEKLFV